MTASESIRLSLAVLTGVGALLTSLNLFSIVRSVRDLKNKAVELLAIISRQNDVMDTMQKRELDYIETIAELEARPRGDLTG
jgi:hypothetical protein